MPGHTRGDRSRNESGDNAVYATESISTSTRGADRVLGPMAQVLTLRSRDPARTGHRSSHLGLQTRRPPSVSSSLIGSPATRQHRHSGLSSPAMQRRNPRMIIVSDAPAAGPMAANR